MSCPSPVSFLFFNLFENIFMALTQCPECGGTLSTTAAECPHCGMRVELCRKCGAVLPAESRVCPQCGARVEHKVPESVRRLRRQRRRLLVGTVLLGLIVLIFTCPGKLSHEQAVAQVVREAIDEVADSLGAQNSLYRMGGQLAKGLTGGLVWYHMKTKRYLIVSVGRVEYDGQEHIVSIGAARHVWCLVRKDDVKQAVLQWFTEHQEKVESKIPDLVRHIGKAISDIFSKEEQP